MRLGAARWRVLHRPVYVAVLMAVVHHLLAAKVDLTAPLLHAAVAAVLLSWRLVRRG